MNDLYIRIHLLQRLNVNKCCNNPSGIVFLSRVGSREPAPPISSLRVQGLFFVRAAEPGVDRSFRCFGFLSKLIFSIRVLKLPKDGYSSFDWFFYYLFLLILFTGRGLYCCFGEANALFFCGMLALRLWDKGPIVSFWFLWWWKLSASYILLWRGSYSTLICSFFFVLAISLSS